MRRIHGILMSACFQLVLACGIPTAHAQATMRFDLPAQPLADSLRAVGSESNTNILFDPPLVAGIVAPALRGNATVDQALTRLLEGTRIKHEFLNETTVVLTDGTGPSPTRGSLPDGSASKTRDVNLQEGSPNALIPPLHFAQNSPSDSTSRAQTADIPVPTRDDQPPKKEGLEEIVVTGTHIRGAAPLSPVKTITNQDLVDQGYSRLDQAIAQLPENFGDGSSQTSNTTLGVGNGAALNPGFASSVNLFGLGTGTTLILLNGQRMAPTGFGSHVDISGIPTSIIDRVEIVEDGASAIYGADAIGGVVNILTRKDYSGFETGARVTGVSHGKDPNYGGYALGGMDWGSGNLLLDFDYEKDHPLLGSSRSFAASLPGPLDLLPEGENFRAYVAGRQAITDQLSVSVQVLAPYRKYFSVANLGQPYGLSTQYGSETQPTAAVEMDYDWAANWSSEFSGGFSEDVNHTWGTYSGPGYPLVGASTVTSKSAVAEERINGKLFELPGGAAQLAIGGQFKSDSYIIQDGAQIVGGVLQPPLPGQNDKREVTSAYGELLLPLIAARNDVPFVRELTLDIAGRFDHFSDFGSTANPKIAIKWQLVDGLSLHGSYAKSFKAPLFDDMHQDRYLYESYPQSDPSSPTGVSGALIQDGGNPNLQPERSKSFNAGLEYKPQRIPELAANLSYFHFDYTNQVERIELIYGFGNFIVNAPQLGSLVTLHPTPAQIAAAYVGIPTANIFDYAYLLPAGSPAGFSVLANGGYANAASSNVQGLTGDLHYDIKGRFGELTESIDATVFTKYQTTATPGASPLDVFNRYGQPLKFRAKANVGWKFHEFAAYARVNYANAYHNNQDPACNGIVGCSVPVASWTTFDIGVSYTTPDQGDNFLTRGLRIGFDIVNLFDREPPYAVAPGPGSNLTYDPINANPLQRAFALTVTKKWGRR